MRAPMQKLVVLAALSGLACGGVTGAVPPPKHTFEAWTDLQAELTTRLPPGWSIDLCIPPMDDAEAYKACTLKSDTGSVMFMLGHKVDAEAARAALAEEPGTTVFGDSRGEIRERDGRALVNVTAYDMVAADTIALALAPDGADLAAMMPAFAARLAAVPGVGGVKCEDPEEGYLLTQSCRFTIDGKIGLAILAVSPDLAKASRMRMGGQSVVGQPGGSVSVNVGDPKAATAFLDALFTRRVRPPAPDAPAPAAPTPPG